MNHPILTDMLSRAARVAAMCAATLGALPALALPTTIGPFLDLQESVSALSGPQKLMTKTELTVQGNYFFNAFADSFGNITYSSGFQPFIPLTACGSGATWPQVFAFCETIKFLDWITISPAGTGGFTDPIAIKGLSYLTYDYGDLTGNIQVTTLYGQDVPNGSPLKMAAFDPAGPPVNFFNEQIIGRSGAAYDASYSGVVPLYELGTVLGSGFDLSGIGGDPRGRVFAFQTKLPINEIMPTVPEPSSYALVAGSLALLGFTRRRGRPGPRT